MRTLPGCVLVVAALVAAPLSAAAAVAAGEDESLTLAAIARRAMDTGSTPGMSVAVVRDDRVIWSAGFGDADRESGRRVRPETRFYIASTSKALTALAATRLVARGLLDLDAPLSKALPGAAFSPSVKGDTIRVRDLLTHTHGIDPEGPLTMRVAISGDYENADLLRCLAAHGAAKNGREFRYSNLGYDLLGIALAPGETRGWKTVVDREVTEPLGMNATTAYRSRIADDLLAMPYEMMPSGFERLPLAKEDANMGPAGGHFSTAPDLALLLIAELNGGRLDGRVVIPPEVIAETQRQQVAQDREFGPYHRHGWGLGWDLGTYNGDTIIHRFGSFAGYRSHVSFMPARKLGVVVLVNGDALSSSLADVVATSIYDHLLGVTGAGERLEAGLAQFPKVIAQIKTETAAALAKRAARSQVLLRPLAAYAGLYTNPVWGTLELRVQDGRLEAVMGVARSKVEVFDAAKDQLRVVLFGTGNVIEARFGDGDGSARELELREVIYTRKP